MKSRHVLPLQAQSMSELEQFLTEQAPQSEVIEIWLDTIRDLDLGQLFKLKKKIKKPFLMVNKASWEGGHFKGTEAQRITSLIQAMERGADYVDVGMQTEESWIQKVVDHKQKHGSQLLLSHHDFESTPPLEQMKKIIEKAHRLGADFVKLATQVNHLEENLILFELTTWAKSKKIPIITIGMGKLGKISRVVCPLLGSAFYFAPVVSSHKTAPGQLTKDELKTIWEKLKDNQRPPLRTP